MDGGKILDTNARRKMLLNSSSKPPIPKSSKLKLGLIMEECVALLPPPIRREESDVFVNAI